MITLMTHAAWSLVAAFALSLVYELYRATLKAGTSRYDSMSVFITQRIPFYILAGVIIALLFSGAAWAAWIGLIVSIILILVSIFYYNPRIMIERKPGLLDWFEDLVYTGLLFVAAALLLYAVLGKRLS
jgi:O-antigen/teichoic acid export membrane protein